MNKILVCVFIVGTVCGCESHKNEKALQRSVDSLNAELKSSLKTAEVLQEVGSLMDSIDANRKVLKTRMVEGTSYQEYASRMREINEYVKEAQTRISFLENRVKTIKQSTSGYVGTIKKLKHDLDLRNQELIALQDQVAKYRNESENLIQTVNLQKAEIEDKLNQLKQEAIKIDTLQRKVNDLLIASKIDEAESFFARAQAVEETANRTKFAPRKKRNTRKEALELYKMAVSYGKAEAQSKVTELEKKL